MPARLPSLLAAPPAAAGRLWLTGARLFDGAGVREAAGVLVSDGRIERVALHRTRCPRARACSTSAAAR